MKNPHSRPTFVYVMGVEGDTHIKIGIASDTDRRLAQIQSANPQCLYIARRWGPFSRRDAARIETNLHSFFSDFCIRGEWFFLIDPDDVSERMALACSGDESLIHAGKLALFDKVVHG